ncbi:MAG: Hpt domain-containing protein [Polaribacter sp.]|jgi:hypothetical protein
MEEPNLSFIKEVTGDDDQFQESILTILKKEFPEEKETYLKNISIFNFNAAADDVHKLKHKICLLALSKSCELAAQYEKDLKKGNTEFHQDFVKVLNKIHVYLNI